MTEIVTTPTEDTRSTGGDSDDLWHVYCCKDEDLGLCGTDLSDMEECEPDVCDDICIVCDDIDNLEDACKACPLTLRGKW